MSATESLTVRIKKPVKQGLGDLARLSERSMSYHAEKALAEYVAREKHRLEALAREIETGIESLNAGKGVRMNRKLFDDIKQRGRERLNELSSRK